MQDLVPEQIILRRTVQDRFGGQRQGGISTPKQQPVILLFTGYGGAQHGYADGWADDVFCYFGEGQVGDMQWIKGNRAVRDHAANGKDLLLFQMLKKPAAHVQFLGAFATASWEYRQAPDQGGTMRQAIVFHLVPVATSLPEPPSGTDLATLRAMAQIAGKNAPGRKAKQALMTYFERSAAVRDYALARAKGVCELCSKAAPFNTKDGIPFLEVHHINRLSDGGPDRLDAVAAVCPNCHREAHHGDQANALKENLLAIIRKIESLVPGGAAAGDDS